MWRFVGKKHWKATSKMAVCERKRVAVGGGDDNVDEEELQF